VTTSAAETKPGIVRQSVGRAQLSSTFSALGCAPERRLDACQGFWRGAHENGCTGKIGWPRASAQTHVHCTG
jgi:hypothetical protein